MHSQVSCCANMESTKTLEKSANSLKDLLKIVTHCRNVNVRLSPDRIIERRYALFNITS